MTSRRLSGLLILIWIAVFAYVLLVIKARLSEIEASGLPLLLTWRVTRDDLVRNGCSLKEKKAPMTLDGLGFETARELGAAADSPPPEGCRRFGIDHWQSAAKPPLSGPSVCVLARTYHRALGSTYSFLHSLFAGRYEALQVFLLDSYPVAGGRSHPELEALARELNDCRVSISPVNTAVNWSASVFACFQRHHVPKFRDPFGYDRTEAELQRLLHRNARLGPSAPGFCEYFLITNNDNLYSVNLFAGVETGLQSRAPVIVVNFTTHHANWFMRHDSGIDIGAALLHHSLFTPGRPVFLHEELLVNIQGAHDADSRLFARLRAASVEFLYYGNMVYFMHQ